MFSFLTRAMRFLWLNNHVTNSYSPYFLKMISKVCGFAATAVFIETWKRPWKKTYKYITSIFYYSILLQLITIVLLWVQTTKVFCYFACDEIQHFCAVDHWQLSTIDFLFWKPNLHLIFLLTCRCVYVFFFRMMLNGIMHRTTCVLGYS